MCTCQIILILFHYNISHFQRLVLREVSGSLSWHYVCICFVFIYMVIVGTSYFYSSCVNYIYVELSCSLRWLPWKNSIYNIQWRTYLFHHDMSIKRCLLQKLKTWSSEWDGRFLHSTESSCLLARTHMVFVHLSNLNHHLIWCSSKAIWWTW